MRKHVFRHFWSGGLLQRCKVILQRPDRANARVRNMRGYACLPGSQSSAAMSAPAEHMWMEWGVFHIPVGSSWAVDCWDVLRSSFVVVFEGQEASRQPGGAGSVIPSRHEGSSVNRCGVSGALRRRLLFSSLNGPPDLKRAAPMGPQGPA